MFRRWSIPTSWRLSSSLPAFAETPKEATAKLKGDWIVLSATMGGWRMPWMDRPNWRFIIAEDRITLKNFIRTTTFGQLNVERSKDEEAPFTVDPSTTPKSLNVTLGGEKLLGIYSLDSDDLRICLAADKRPAEFVSDAKSKALLFVLKRAGPDTANDYAEKTIQRAIEMERGRFQGVWAVVEGEENGNVAGAEALKNFRVEFTGDLMTATSGVRIQKMKILIDPESTPRAFDQVYVGGPIKGAVVRGIYTWDGNKLKLCFTTTPNEARPTEFAAKKDRASLVLQKIKE